MDNVDGFAAAEVHKRRKLAAIDFLFSMAAGAERLMLRAEYAGLLCTAAAVKKQRDFYLAAAVAAEAHTCEVCKGR